MMISINGNKLYVEDHGPKDGIPMIVHHDGPGLGDHTEPKRAFAAPTNISSSGEGCGM